MEQTYTQPNLIQYLYGDCDVFETFEIEHALDEDSILRAEYEGLCKVKAILLDTKMSPSLKVCDKIKFYART